MSDTVTRLPTTVVNDKWQFDNNAIEESSIEEEKQPVETEAFVEKIY